ncbi:MAG TPA: Flp pilus assembly protein CpaB [Armatimonadetes bacterium]|nr:Flp pilus assembly protein CpaB [Armatimonadota bacterium]
MAQLTRQKVIIAALTLGVVSGVLMYVFLSGRIAQSNVNYNVVVAKRDIPKGTILSTDMIQIKSLHRNIIPAGAAVNPAAVTGRATRYKILAGQPISQDDLLPLDHLSYIIPPFMRAISVGLDPVVGVAGFIRPGDHVDVIATFTIGQGTITKTILQDVELLATGTQATARQSGNTGDDTAKSNNQPNATLLVLPTQAERLILADEKGKIRLALRRADDKAFAKTPGVTGRAVIGPVPPDAPESQELFSRMFQPVASQPDINSLLAKFRQSIATRAPVYPKPTPVVQKPVEAVKVPVTEKHIQIIRGTKVEDVVVPE